MKITKTMCDRCRNEGASEISFVTGRCCDASGNSADVTRYADLCPMCTRSLLYRFAESIRGTDLITSLDGFTLNGTRIFEECRG